MIQFDFMQYMEEVASLLKETSHSEDNKRFFRISGIAGLEEFLAQMPDNQYPAIMAVEQQDGSISDNHGDNFTDTPSHEFYVVQNYSFGSHEQRTIAKEKCKAIGQKILAKMLYDKSQKTHGLTFLQFKHIPYFTVGPFGDKVIAVYFKIENHQSANLVYNPNDWN